MKNKLVKAISTTLAVTAVGVQAGDQPVANNHSAASSGGSWCEDLKALGDPLYKNSENGLIQEIDFFGRFQYQYGYSDVDNNGVSTSGDGDEIRRMRAGLSVKFLNGFKAVGRANIQDGGFRNHEAFQYGGMDELYLNYGLGSVAGFEDVTVGYGRYKVLFGGEEAMSSKKIKTIERSNLNNILGGKRATGALLGATRGDYDLAFGVFSSNNSDQDFADWDGDNFYFASAGRDLDDNSSLRADLIIGDADTASIFKADWAGSLTYQTEAGIFDVMTNVTYVDQGADDIYGIVIMPSYEIIEDQLEAVFRYQWAESTGNTLQASKRNIRNVAANEDPAGYLPRGDNNQTFYAGLNYFICDHHAKVMLGAEYETLDGGDGDLEATTLWAAFRAYF